VNQDLQILADRALSFRDEFQALDVADLRQRSTGLRDALHPWSDEELHEGLALVSEAIDRTHGDGYNPQLIGSGAALLRGFAIEASDRHQMSVAFAAYVHAAQGDAVHIVTTSGNLASHDSLTRISLALEMLGLDVAIIGEDTPEAQRREAYEADVVYGDLAVLATDYLRDCLAKRVDELMFKRRQPHAIVATVDYAVEAAHNIHFIAAQRRGIPTPTIPVTRFRRGKHYVLNGSGVVFTRRGLKDLEKEHGSEALLDATKYGFLGTCEAAIAVKYGQEPTDEILGRITAASFLRSYRTLSGFVTRSRIPSLEIIYDIPVTDLAQETPPSTTPGSGVRVQPSPVRTEIDCRLTEGLAFDAVEEELRADIQKLRESVSDTEHAEKLMLTYIHSNLQTTLSGSTEERVQAYRARQAALEPSVAVEFRRKVLIEVIDVAWRELLSELDMAIRYIDYFCEKSPLECYRHLALKLSDRMRAKITQRSVHYYFSIKL